MARKLSITVLTLALVTASGLYFLANREVRAQVDGMIEQAMRSGAYEEITYGSVEMALDGDIRLKELRVVDAQQQEYTVEEVVVSDYDLEHDIPWYVTLTARGFRFPEQLPHVDPGTSPALYAYIDSLREGGTLPLQIDYRYRYDPNDGYLLESEMSFNLDKAASGHFSSTMRNVPLEQFFAGDMDPALAQMRLFSSLMAAKIPQADLRVTDHGIVNAMLEINARESNAEPAEFRARLQRQAESLHLFLPAPLEPFARGAGAELSRFLEGGRTLELSLRPAHDGDMQLLQTEMFAAFIGQNYPRIVELLNLRVDTLEP